MPRGTQMTLRDRAGRTRQDEEDVIRRGGRDTTSKGRAVSYKYMEGNNRAANRK